VAYGQIVGNSNNLDYDIRSPRRLRRPRHSRFGVEARGRGRQESGSVQERGDSAKPMRLRLVPLCATRLMPHTMEWRDADGVSSVWDNSDG